MTKKNYMKPAIELDELDMTEQLLGYSVQTTGLGDNPEDELTQEEIPGDSWDEAMSRRRRHSIWDNEEL